MHRTNPVPRSRGHHASETRRAAIGIGKEPDTLADGELVVGLDDAPPVPMQQGRPDCGDFRGYEVDLLNALADALGVTLRYRRAAWSTIIQELADGAVDVVCSAATITAERRAVVDFCRPHLQIHLSVVGRAHDASGMSLSERRIGVRSGTTAEDYVRAVGVDEPSMLSASNDALYAALASGAVDVVVDDSPIAEHFAGRIEGLRRVGVLPGTDAAYGIVVRKGNDTLRVRIDAALESMEASGALAALQSRWRLTGL